MEVDLYKLLVLQTSLNRFWITLRVVIILWEEGNWLNYALKYDKIDLS